MIYVKVNWPSGTYCVLSAVRVNRNEDVVEVYAPHGSDRGIEMFELAYFREICLMSVTGQTIGKIEGRAEVVLGVTVLVNDAMVQVAGSEVSREQIIAEAYPGAVDDDGWTVTYRGGRTGDGELRVGSVSVENGMVFKVTRP